VPRFMIVHHPTSSADPIDFSDFIETTRGLSISSVAASTDESRGPDFLELGLSRTFNLRLQANGNTLIVSLVSTLNADEFAPVRLEVIGRDEVITAERLQRRLYYLRQVVIARSFFLNVERDSALRLPQIPACGKCNNEKSGLELYVGSSLLIGSKHPEANLYRSEKVRPRLERNRRLWNELNLDAPPKWVGVNGVLQPMHAIKIDPEKIVRLLQMIVRGLYYHHYGKPLSREMWPDVQMVRPENESAMWASLGDYFPAGAPRVNCDLGRGTFRYSCVQSPENDGFTAWVISMHGKIFLHGEDGSSDHWWCMTRPTPEAVAAAKAR
jgi:hypothetical protein